MSAMKKPIKQSKAAKPSPGKAGRSLPVPAPSNPRWNSAMDQKKKINSKQMAEVLTPVMDKAIAHGDMKKVGNQSVKDFINKGHAAQKAVDQVIAAAPVKNYAEKQINVLLLPHESRAIDQLRALRPTSRRNAKRLAISIHDWIVEAIQEKIKKDFEANGLQLGSDHYPGETQES